ncbi:GNAT family N-acetyltransferase [Demequina sp. NBRC 110053]|uniref:GNAT family N-acetyltransferase n=1 Tax=Demequina sp. NBRC 110053 TaxID=1570342 RepID=UPI000A042CCA|nr:GNAT family N-acetyltransferase [Demequina sp. NBRC 110053]
MRATVLRIEDVDAGMASAWRELVDRSASSNGWLDPRFVLPARDWAVMARDLSLCVATDGHRVTGVLPVTPHRPFRRLRPEFLVTGGRFVDWHADSTLPLLDRAAPQAAMAALLRAALDGWRRVRVELRGMPTEGVVGAALGDALADRPGSVTRGETWSRPFVPPRAEVVPIGPGRATALLVGHMSGRRRREVLRRARALERHLDGEIVLRRADPGRASEDFETFQSSGWKGDVRSGGRGVLQDRGYRDWYRAVVAEFMSDGDLIAHELCVGDTVVYMHLALRSGGRAFGFLDAYLGGLEAQRVGTLGRLAVSAELAHAPDLDGFEPGVSRHDREVTRMMPASYEVADVTVHAAGLGGWVSRSVPAVEGLRRRLGRDA